MGFLTDEMDAGEREQLRRERQAFLSDWGVEKPTAEIGLGGIERRCAVCGSAWVDVGGGVQACEKDPAHAEMVERVVEAQVAEPIPDPRSPNRMGWRAWKRQEPPKPVGPDQEASEALEAVSALVGELLVALAAADQACRASTAELEQQMTAAGMRGEYVEREWREGFKRAAATLQAIHSTVGDVSMSNDDLPRLRLALQSLQLVLRETIEEAENGRQQQ